MAEELKCCPFCGAACEIVKGQGHETWHQCSDQARCPAGPCTATAEEWNRRVEPPAVSDERIWEIAEKALVDNPYCQYSFPAQNHDSERARFKRNALIVVEAAIRAALSPNARTAP